MRKGGRPTEFKPYIRWADQDFNLIIHLEVVFAHAPEAAVLFFEFGFIGGGEVGFDFAEDVGVYFSLIS